MVAHQMARQGGHKGSQRFRTVREGSWQPMAWNAGLFRWFSVRTSLAVFGDLAIRLESLWEAQLVAGEPGVEQVYRGRLVRRPPANWLLQRGELFFLDYQLGARWRPSVLHVP
jgi:hypothetical protein